MLNATFRQLQIFSAAARRLSFARVAEELHLTPAAVSFQIRQLEDAGGFLLFERIGKRIQLTTAGQLLLDHANVALRAMRDADEGLAALDNPTVGDVTVGLVSTAKYIVPHILARFRTSHPGARVRLIDGNRHEILSLLRHGGIDLAVTGRLPDDMDAEAQAFADHPYVIIAPPDHPLASRHHLGIAELAGEPFVVREEGSGSRLMVHDLLEQAGLAANVVMTSSSNETIKQAVMAGVGLAGLSRHTVGLELGLGLLAALDIEGSPWMKTWFVVHRRSAPLLPLHARLEAFILGEGAQVIAALEAEHALAGARGLREA